ncbi:MAG: AAA family ATPase [Candidatus Pacebacteria bacterium]|nr:AAA family ATPase [Candidatus Paceibacterota bacterium]
MNLLRFRIKHYKSIIDSGDCYFSDKLTILAGKNESGKTSVLEALEDFHQDRAIRDGAKPIGGDGVPEVSITFTLTSADVSDIFTAINSDKSVAGEVNMTLTKMFGPSKYTIDLESRKQLGVEQVYDLSVGQIQKSIEEIDLIIKQAGIDVSFPRLEKQQLSDFKSEILKFKSENLGLEDVTNVITSIENVVDAFCAQEKFVVDFVDEFVASHLPYFILFSSFDDAFPESISVASLAKDEWALDLEKVSDFSVAKMASANRQEQVNHENSVNVDFTNKFNEYWTQDKIRLHVKKDGTEVYFWIVEDNKLYLPSQRSKGQQWYLSFYVKIVARLQEGKPNVILIDEPGLYLHAKAQKDLLKVLLNHTDENPVVFSTHSPYLITEDNLENVRLVEKVGGGTRVLGKIHAHPVADKETLTPVLTAIGLGINDSITNLDQKDNVVVEGQEDVFYLRAFKEIEDKALKTNFMDGGGASKMGFIGAILEGWGANVYYLYDNDQGKKDGEKGLESWRVLPEIVKSVSKTEGATIVDIFSSDDFKKWVLEVQDNAYSSTNSQYIKELKPRPDKVLLARKFLQKAKAGLITLDATTKSNIAALFNEIKFER